MLWCSLLVVKEGILEVTLEGAAPVEELAMAEEE